MSWPRDPVEEMAQAFSDVMGMPLDTARLAVQASPEVVAAWLRVEAPSVAEEIIARTTSAAKRRKGAR